MLRLSLLLLIGLFLKCPALCAQENNPKESAENKPQHSSFEHLLTVITKSILLEALPTEYLEDDDWGKTHKFTEGVKFTGKLKNLSLERRRVERKHGSWKRYKAWIVDPEQDIQLSIKDFHLTEGETHFTVLATVRVKAEAELQQWLRGAKLLGVSVVGTSHIKLTMQCKVASKIQSASLIGLLTQTNWKPEVLKSDLELQKFKLNRIGAARGPAVHELGDQLKGKVRKKLNQYEEKLTEKANRAIEKELAKGSISTRLLKEVSKSF